MLCGEVSGGRGVGCGLERGTQLRHVGCFLFLFNRASLWSSCVVLPLLALTWMSAVLAMTDKRSILFQILFAVFDSLQGFVIVMVHCILRREVRQISFVKRDSEKSEGVSELTSVIFNCYLGLVTKSTFSTDHCFRLKAEKKH